MTEFGVNTPNQLHSRVWEEENNYEEGLRETFLVNRLVHFGYLIDRLHSEGVSLPDLDELQERFVRDKKGLNMGEVFALAMSDEYRYKLHVVELGKTTQPEVTQDIDGLKGQYNDFIDWIAAQPLDNVRIEELSRKESGREVEYRLPRLEEAHRKAMILTRRRTLMHGVMQYDGAPINIGIFKRMVFSVPLETFVALQAGSSSVTPGRFTDERTLRMVETMLDHHSGGIKPIRTAYYLASDQG